MKDRLKMKQLQEDTGGDKLDTGIEGKAFT